MSQELIEALASRIAEKVFYHVSDIDRYRELRELLIEFANEIKRQAIEP